MEQTYIGYHSIETLPPPDFFHLSPHAQRFEVGSAYLPAIIGQKSSIEWLTGVVRTDWMFQRIQTLCKITREELGRLPGVQIITPLRSAGLLAFRIDGIHPERLVEQLGKKRIVIRPIKNMGFVRVSLGFFNTENEVEQLVKAVSEVIHLTKADS